MTSQPTTPPVVRAATVHRSPTDAFRIFTDEIGAWWPLPSHGLFGSTAGGVVFRDGRLIELSVEGAEAVWGEVLEWDPPRRLKMTWHPGRPDADGSTVTVDFEPTETGTRVVIEHDGWQAFGDEAMARRRTYVGPGAWGYVLDHYADGAEHRVDGADLSGLAAAYDAFFAAAGSGDFDPPVDDGWDADQVLAHVALNDAAMIAVCQSLVHGGELRFENEVCHDRELMASWIDAAGDRAGLIERGQSMARLVQGALRRLSPSQLGTEVHCLLRHEGEVMVDAPRPWGAVAIEVQAGMHLPAHVTQLENLRA